MQESGSRIINVSIQNNVRNVCYGGHNCQPHCDREGDKSEVRRILRPKKSGTNVH